MCDRNCFNCVYEDCIVDDVTKEEEDEQKYRDIAGYEVAFANIMRSMKNLNSKIKDYPPVPEEEQ